MLNTLLPTLPLLVPFTTAIILLLLVRRVSLQQIISLVGASAQAVVGALLLTEVQRSGVIVTEVSNWPAPFGIVIVVDLFSAIMVMIVGVMGLAVAIYSLASMDRDRESYGYHALFHILLMGVTGAFITGDLFNLYVWFELLLITSFVLMSLGGTGLQLEGSIKYVLINLFSSTMFLTAIGILYHLVGTVNMADISQQIPLSPQPGLMTTVAVMLIIAFGVKAAVFPLFFWLPDSYPTPPIPVTTIFSALLTKVGVYAMIRTFTLMFTQEIIFTHTIILVLGGFTMVTGVLGAVSQFEFRRLLSFHIISQIGYLLMGLGIYTELALAGTIYFLIHVIIAKSALFLVSGVVGAIRGTYNLKELGGLYDSNPALALFFLLPALALAGIPPFSGFWAKFALVRAGLEAQQYIITGVALAVSVLTLYSMVKVWRYVFWQGAPEGTNTADDHLPGSVRASYLLPMVTLGLLTLILGVLAEPVFALSTEAAAQLLNPDAYLAAVLGR